MDIWERIRRHGAGEETLEVHGNELKGLDLRGANLRGAYLVGADLTDADLRGADLTGANLDYASWTWSCKTIGVKSDDKQSRQQCYHWLVNNWRHLKAAGFPMDALQQLADYANGFHRVLSGDVAKITLED